MSRMSATPRRCHCGMMVSSTRAWTKDNPGRRFFACPDYDAETDRRGCKYFRWVDTDPPTTWQTDVILGLMEEKQHLKQELLSMRKDLYEANKYSRKVVADYTLLKFKRAAKLGCRFQVVQLCSQSVPQRWDQQANT